MADAPYTIQLEYRISKEKREYADIHDMTRIRYDPGAPNAHSGIDAGKKSDPRLAKFQKLTGGSTVGCFASDLVPSALAVSANTSASDAVEYGGLSRCVNRVEHG